MLSAIKTGDYFSVRSLSCYKSHHHLLSDYERNRTVDGNIQLVVEKQYDDRRQLLTEIYIYIVQPLAS